MNPIRINGIRTINKGIDLDGDGKTGGTEYIQQRFDPNKVEVSEPTETKEIITELNKDVENADNLSSIDFLSRVDRYQLPSIVAVSTLRGMKFLPHDASMLVRIYMRQVTSIDGLGRGEIIEAVSRKQELDVRKLSGMQQGKNFAGFGGNG